MIKYITTFLITSSILLAGDSFMEHFKFYDYGMLYSMLLLIIILPIWGVAIIYNKTVNKSNNFFNFLLYADLFLFAISWVASMINAHIEAQNKKPRHYFQKPYMYGVYKKDKVLYEENNSSIIDIHINNYKDKPNYLTENGLLVCKKSCRFNSVYNYIDVNYTKPTMAQCNGCNSKVILLSKNDDILNYKINNEYNRKNYFNINEDYFKVNSISNKNKDKNYWSIYKELYLDHLEINNTKLIKKYSDYKLFAVMDKKKKEITIYGKGIAINSFKLDSEPKLVAYNDKKDRFYIVYKNNDTKIYELKNELTKVYTKAKSIVNSAFIPWWKFIKIPIKGMSKKDIKAIRNFYDNKRRIDFNYIIKPLKNKIYHINVYSDDYKPHSAMHFTIQYSDNNFKLLNFKFKERKLKEKKPDLSAKTLSKLKNRKIEQKEPIEQNELWKAAKDGISYGRRHFKGVNANIKNAKGQTPLMIAVKNGYYDVVNDLAEADVDVWAKDNEGKSAFDYIKKGKTDNEKIYAKRMYGTLRILEVKQIIKGKANLIQHSYYNDTDKLSIIIENAKCDAFTFPKNTHCKTYIRPRIYATPIETYAHDIQRGVPPIFAAIQNHLYNKLRKLLDDGANIELKNKFGDTPLIFAIYQNDSKLVKILLEYGANPNVIDGNGLYTPLSKASDSNMIEIVKLLLKYGADINYQHNESETALTVAAKGCKKFELVKLLLKHGANPRIMDTYNQNTITALHGYCKEGENYQKMLKLLKGNQDF